MLQVVFWAAVGLILYTHAGYPLLLWLLARVKGRPAPVAQQGSAAPPSLSLIVAARNEEAVIADKVRNALALDYPRARLEVIVASDGSTDATAPKARAAGADVVLELPHRGKVSTQDAGVEAAGGEVLVFSDANTRLDPDAARLLVAALGDGVGYVCGHVHFTRGDGTNQEGAYWRYETGVRSLESRLGSVTAGNGGLYATRRESYIQVDPRMGHDLSLPFNMVKRGWRAVYEPRARAVEKMTPTTEDEYRRKRRMMSRTWLILMRSGILSPRGYGPLYALQVLSHRLLRYLTPFLHLIAFAANVALLGHGWVYTVTLGLQLALLAAAALARLVPGRPLQLARYYVLVTAAPAAGLWDSLRHPVSAGWEKAEGTR